MPVFAHNEKRSGRMMQLNTTMEQSKLSFLYPLPVCCHQLFTVTSLIRIS